MLAPDLVTHLLDVISWHRTWLAVKDFGTYGQIPATDSSRTTSIVTCRFMRFEVRVARPGFRRFQCILLSEIALENAIREQSSQSDFKHRVTDRQLTYRDINLLVGLASEGTIDLELESYT